MTDINTADTLMCFCYSRLIFSTDSEQLKITAANVYNLDPTSSPPPEQVLACFV
jgi:hypothetical protein